MNRFTVVFFALLCLVSACTKEDIIVPGNVPPPDKTIDSTVIEVFVGKAYVNLMGREPIGNEKQLAINQLKAGGFQESSRKQFIDGLLATNEFKNNVYQTARIEYLQNFDSTDFAQQAFVYAQLLNQPQYAPFYDLIQQEITKLNELMSARTQFMAGTIDHRTLLKRMVNNYFYDQINMGTENFVISTFQHFFFRYPTISELSNGKQMVDGNNATLLLQTGSTKTDYLNIFFGSDDFYEGQVRYVFLKFLTRNPTPAEMALYAAAYKNSNNFTAIYSAALSTSEYAGLK